MLHRITAGLRLLAAIERAPLFFGLLAAAAPFQPLCAEPPPSVPELRIVGDGLPPDTLFAPDGEYLFLVESDGQVRKYALPNLSPLAGVELNESVRGAAISHDGRFLALGAPESGRLLILDAANLQLVKKIATRPSRGNLARVAHIEAVASRNAFLVTFSDTPQLWEVNYQIPPPAGFGTWVHDYRKDSGEATATAFPARKLWLKNPLPRFLADPDGVFVSGIDSSGQLVVFDMDLGRTTATLPLPSAASVTAHADPRR